MKGKSQPLENSNRNWKRMDCKEMQLAFFALVSSYPAMARRSDRVIVNEYSMRAYRFRELT